MKQFSIPVYRQAVINAELNTPRYYDGFEATTHPSSHDVLPVTTSSKNITHATSATYKAAIAYFNSLNHNQLLNMLSQFEKGKHTIYTSDDDEFHFDVEGPIQNPSISLLPSYNVQVQKKRTLATIIVSGNLRNCPQNQQLKLAQAVKREFCRLLQAGKKIIKYKGLEYRVAFQSIIR